MMMDRIGRRFFKLLAKEEKSMKPFLLKCGLALALAFAGLLYSHIGAKRIKPSPTSPKGHPSGLFINMLTNFLSLFQFHESK